METERVYYVCLYCRLYFTRECAECCGNCGSSLMPVYPDDEPLTEEEYGAENIYQRVHAARIRDGIGGE